MDKVLTRIDAISIWSGKIFSWLVIPLIAIVAYDTIIRQVYRSTIWVFDTALWLYAGIFLLGGAWVLQQHAHIRIDVILQKYPPRARAIFELFWYLILFSVVVIVLLIYGGDYAWEAWVLKEISIYSPWTPLLWHFKAIIPLAFLLLLPQGIAEFIRNLRFAIRGK